MATATGMLEGIVTWARELCRPDNARSPSVIALETVLSGLAPKSSE
jgi:hypothetical protein